jgi:hypothetical protein
MFAFGTIDWWINGRFQRKSQFTLVITALINNKLDSHSKYR